MLTRTHTTRRRGFTLLELIAVMVIIAIAMAAVVPSLRNFGKGRQAADTAAGMLMLLRHGRAEAISEARAVRFNIDADSRTYYLTVEEDGVWQRMETSWGRRFEMPAQMRIEWNGDPLRDWQYVEMQPTGTIGDARIDLRLPSGGTYRIVCREIGQVIRVAGETEVLP